MLRRFIFGTIAAAVSVCFSGCLGLDIGDIQQIAQEASNIIDQTLDTPQAEVYHFKSPLRLSAEESTNGVHIVCTQTMGNYYSDYKGWIVNSKSEKFYKVQDLLNSAGGNFAVVVIYSNIS